MLRVRGINRSLAFSALKAPTLITKPLFLRQSTNDSMLSMDLQIIKSESLESRKHWLAKIADIGHDFGQDTRRLQLELSEELEGNNSSSLISHLRLCGAIPESYGHDTSEEKLYSKYTDMLLNACFKFLGLNSIVLTERADAADVEVIGDGYSFVADAKAFRLSRTAKNQKDFKIQAMDTWKRGKPYALVVCPLYQLPTKASQIYQQAATRNVCVLSYSHLAVLIAKHAANPNKSASALLLAIFRAVESMSHSKDANAYWTLINRTMLDFDTSISDLWKTEKIANEESITVAKEEALTFLAQEREIIMNLSHEEAIQRLVTANKIDNKEKVIKQVSDNQLMTLL